jgi:mRNA interferase MazF
MERSEVWWVDFSTSVGTEIQKQRPAVIVSNDVSNQFLGRVQVVPLTSKVGKVFPNQAVVSLRGKKNKALADQLATVDKSRLKNLAGRLVADDMKRLESAILIQLDITT